MLALRALLRMGVRNEGPAPPAAPIAWEREARPTFSRELLGPRPPAVETLAEEASVLD